VNDELISTGEANETHLANTRDVLVEEGRTRSSRRAAAHGHSARSQQHSQSFSHPSLTQLHVPWFQPVSPSVVHAEQISNWSGQGRCAANLVRWHQASDPSCICGNPRQTMDHIVNHCPITRFPGGLKSLHQARRTAT